MQMHNPAHPGEILLELYFEPLGLTVEQAAAKLAVPAQSLQAVVEGRQSLTAELALRLVRAFTGTTATYWLGLQNQYDLWQLSQQLDLGPVQVLQ
jgi:addiction module HigA family antidote